MQVRMRRRNTTVAELTAQTFVEKFGIDCGQRLDQVAEGLGLRIMERDAHGYDGALLRIVGIPLGTIVVRSSIRQPARKRFTLAHEIGHYVLPNQQELRQPCAGRDIENWASGTSAAEVDANRFAAEILMPRVAIAELVKRAPTLSVASDIAAQCGVSLTAASYRLAELSTHRTAVVVSRRRSVDWYYASEEFGRAVRRGPLDPGTVAHDLFKGEAAPTGVVDVAAESWLFPEGLRRKASIREDSILMPSYDMVLTLLDIFEPIEEWDEEDESGLDPLDPADFTLGRARWPTSKRSS